MSFQGGIEDTERVVSARLSTQPCLEGGAGAVFVQIELSPTITSFSPTIGSFFSRSMWSYWDAPRRVLLRRIERCRSMADKLVTIDQLSESLGGMGRASIISAHQENSRLPSAGESGLGDPISRVGGPGFHLRQTCSPGPPRGRGRVSGNSFDSDRLRVDLSRRRQSAATRSAQGAHWLICTGSTERQVSENE